MGTPFATGAEYSRAIGLPAGPALDEAVLSLLPLRRSGEAWGALAFSTDPHVAWDLFDELRDWRNVKDTSIQSPHWDGWPRRFVDDWIVFYEGQYPDGDSDSDYVSGETMPLAVCRAAIRLSSFHYAEGMEATV